MTGSWKSSRPTSTAGARRRGGRRPTNERDRLPGLTATRAHHPAARQVAGGGRLPQWFADLNANGWTVYLPEITDYELRRELLRSGKTASLARLDLLASSATYLPLTTAAVRLAAHLWAQARNGRWATADPRALDADVILAAQALTLTPAPAGLVVATSNVAHLSRYLPARDWTAIIA